LRMMQYSWCLRLQDWPGMTQIVRRWHGRTVRRLTFSPL
jgi:hypothetical protein